MLMLSSISKLTKAFLYGAVAAADVGDFVMPPPPSIVYVSSL